jgi:hypothetical protein
MSRLQSVCAMILVSTVLASCGGGDGGGGSSSPSATYTVSSGVAQKGPLVKGSMVNVQELDGSLAVTGKSYAYQVTTDLGVFTPNSTFGSRYVAMSATGNYFDEVANTNSAGTVTLTGYADLSTDTALNVNLLTTLEAPRIQALVKSGMAFAAARSQAETEVLAVFDIHNTNHGPFDMLDISKSADGDKILAALSSLFTYGNTAANLNALIASFQSDLAAHGTITTSGTTATLAASAKALNPAAVAANLTTMYASKVTFTASDISNWLDRSGDGVIGKNQFQVTGATQASTFAFPSSVTDPYAGSSVSVSDGRLAVNGTAVTGSATIKAGDAVSVSPPAGAFPNGVLTVYLMSGTTRIGMVSFVSGLTAIAVAPTAVTVPIGVTQQLKATGTFTDSSTADVTTTATWSSSAPNVATVNANSGLITAVATGQANITATSGTVSKAMTVTVSNVSLTSLALTPNPFTTGVGVGRQMRATGTFSDGSTADLTGTASWTTASTPVATVTGGMVSGVAAGSTTVTASLGTFSATGPLTVTAHNTWNPGATVPTTTVYGLTETLLPNGSVLVLGSPGSGGQTAPTPVQIYNPVTDTWSTAADSLTGRYADTSSITLLANRKVLVAGGESSSATVATYLATAEIYDPVANTWSAAASMPTPRENHTATLLANGKVLVAGGFSGDTTTNPGPILYDPIANTWSAAAPDLLNGSGKMATLLKNGKVLVVGSASAETYDPGSNTWAITGNLNGTHDYGPTLTVLPDGRALFAGGNFTTGIAEIYDPATNAWSLTSNMSVNRADAAATLLPNGTVLMSSGYPGSNNYPALTTTEIYNPATGSWSPAATMAHAHVGPAAVLLPNGVVLVLNSTSSELYW